MATSDPSPGNGDSSSVFVELRTLFLVNGAEGHRARVLAVLAAGHLVPDLVGGVRRLHRERHLAAVVEMCRRRRNGAARLVQERRRQRRAHASFGRFAAG